MACQGHLLDLDSVVEGAFRAMVRDSGPVETPDGKAGDGLGKNILHLFSRSDRMGSRLPIHALAEWFRAGDG